MTSTRPGWLLLLFQVAQLRPAGSMSTGHDHARRVGPVQGLSANRAKTERHQAGRGSSRQGEIRAWSCGQAEGAFLDKGWSAPRRWIHLILVVFLDRPGTWIGIGSTGWSTSLRQPKRWRSHLPGSGNGPERPTSGNLVRAGLGAGRQVRPALVRSPACRGKPGRSHFTWILVASP